MKISQSIPGGTLSACYPDSMLAYAQKPNPRREHRQQENQRVQDSASLSQTFPELKKLTVDLAYFRPGSFTRSSEVKYSVNLVHAKSRFRFDCCNSQCVGGDFDLSVALARAVAARKTTTTGELTCGGWHSNDEVGQARCLHILHYKLSADYGEDDSVAAAEGEPS